MPGTPHGSFGNEPAEAAGGTARKLNSGRRLSPGGLMKPVPLKVDRLMLAAIAMATLFAAFVMASPGAARVTRTLAEGALLYLGNTRG